MIIDMPKREDIPSLRTLWREAFSDTDAFLDMFFESAFSEERSRCVYVDGVPVAALYWFDCLCRGERLAYIYAVATAKSYRGRGLASALMRDTHAHLSSLGYEGALLVPGEGSLFDFYERLGYRSATYIGEISASAFGEVSLSHIDGKEYARLRRTLLPEGGVIQEKENIDFLIAQAELYSGEGFLVALRREGERIFGIELLGDTSLAPAILGALGYKTGKFRIPVRERAFSMFIPLREGIEAPEYFGLAFD